MEVSTGTMCCLYAGLMISALDRLRLCVEAHRLGSCVAYS